MKIKRRRNKTTHVLTIVINQNMNTLQIDRVCSKNPIIRKSFRGVYAADKLPPLGALHYPAGLVINHSPGWEEEGHWVAAYVEGPEKKITYFDSLCVEVPESIQEWLDQFEGVERNTHRYQDGGVNNCGAYAIVFLYFMSLGYTFPQFIDILNSNVFVDLFVNEIVNKIQR